MPTRNQLVKRRATTLADAQSKLDAEDFHGCADAMMDLRELDAMRNVMDQNQADEHVKCEAGFHRVRYRLERDDLVCGGCGTIFAVTGREELTVKADA